MGGRRFPIDAAASMPFQYVELLMDPSGQDRASSGLKALRLMARAALGRSSALSVSLWNSNFCGGFGWACRALNRPKRRVWARAAALQAAAARPDQAHPAQVRGQRRHDARAQLAGLSRRGPQRHSSPPHRRGEARWAVPQALWRVMSTPPEYDIYSIRAHVERPCRDKNWQRGMTLRISFRPRSLRSPSWRTSSPVCGTSSAPPTTCAATASWCR